MNHRERRALERVHHRAQKRAQKRTTPRAPGRAYRLPSGATVTREQMVKVMGLLTEEEQEKLALMLQPEAPRRIQIEAERRFRVVLDELERPLEPGESEES